MHANHVSIFIRCVKNRVNGRVLSLSECAVFKFSVVPKQRDKSEEVFASASERNSEPASAGDLT